VNRTTIHLTKRNFYPQFSVLSTGAILGQSPKVLLLLYSSLFSDSFVEALGAIDIPLGGAGNDCRLAAAL
ncbi:MAG: hypothetical protein ACPG5T_09500, partial [Endozoicomonas sp.]